MIDDEGEVERGPTNIRYEMTIEWKKTIANLVKKKQLWEKGGRLGEPSSVAFRGGETSRKYWGGKGLHPGYRVRPKGLSGRKKEATAVWGETKERPEERGYPLK